jgi:hypothetical protein
MEGIIKKVGFEMQSSWTEYGIDWELKFDEL